MFGNKQKNEMPEIPSINSGKELNVPSHDDKPIYQDGNKSDNQVSIPEPKNGIEVVAMRNGFYNQHRISAGSKFFVKEIKKLATWMKCVDPVFEKKRIEYLEEKNAKAKLN